MLVEIIQEICGFNVTKLWKSLRVLNISDKKQFHILYIPDAWATAADDLQSFDTFIRWLAAPSPYDGLFVKR